MEAKFSPRVKEVISFSREEALRLGHQFIGVEHLLLGLIREGEGSAMKTLDALGVDAEKLRKSIESSIEPKVENTVNLKNVPLTKQAERVLKITFLEAKLLHSDIIGTEHLMLSILKNSDNVVSQILDQYSIDYDMFKTELEMTQDDFKNEMNDPSDDEFDEEKSEDFGKSQRRSGDVKSKHLCSKILVEI